MNTLGIVAISLLCGIFLALVLAITSFQLWYGYRLHKLILDLELKFPLLLTDLRTTLKTETDALSAQIQAIRGDELRQYATDAVNAARRIEKAALGFSDLTTALLSGEDLIPGKHRSTGIAPEDYAPPSEDGRPYISQSRTAAGDARALEHQFGDAPPRASRGITATDLDDTDDQPAPDETLR